MLATSITVEIYGDVAHHLRQLSRSLGEGRVLRVERAEDDLVIVNSVPHAGDVIARAGDVPISMPSDIAEASQGVIGIETHAFLDDLFHVRLGPRPKLNVYSPRDLGAELEKMLADSQARYEALPKLPCVAGCGTLTGEGTICGPCSDKAADRKERSTAIRESNIPVKYREITLASDLLAKCVKDPRALQRLREHGPAATQATLIGPAGVGKTTAAFALARRWAWDARQRFQYSTGYELARAPREHELGDDEPPAVARAKNARILLLDDLGSEPAAPNSPIPELIHDRHADDRPTIVTSWMDRAKLAARFGDGTCRRLLEAPALFLDMKIGGGK